MKKYFYNNEEVNDENVTSINRSTFFTDKINDLIQINKPSEVTSAILNTNPIQPKPLVPVMDLGLSDIEVIEYLEADYHDIMMLRHIICNLKYYCQNFKVVENRIAKNYSLLKPIVQETLERYGYDFK